MAPPTTPSVTLVTCRNPPLLTAAAVTSLTRSHLLLRVNSLISSLSLLPVTVL